ncbi:MAG: hypothetical protein ACWA47_03715, partial [Brevirhabdus sp.]
ARLDPTTISTLAVVLRQDFTTAGSWADLRHRLAAKGFDLRERAGRFLLVTRPHGLSVCRVGSLGHPSPRLAKALGDFPT